MDGTVYLNTTGRTEMVALIDSGKTDIRLSNYFLRQISIKEKEFMMEDYSFNCSDYLNVLPIITFGFYDENEEIFISIPQSKLYNRFETNTRKCYPLIHPLGHKQINDNINSETLFNLGLPFFASVYMEMHWKDTKQITDLAQMDFNALVKLAPK